MGKNILKKSSKYILEKVRDRDMYPRPIAFTFKGKEEFRTLFGGLISMAIQVVIVLYAYIMLKIMIERNDTSKSVNTIVSDILNDKSPVSLNTTDFSFAFDAFILDDDNFDFNNNEYFEIELLQWIKQPDTGELSSTNIPYERCGTSLFQYYNQTEVQKLGIQEYLCPLSRNYIVQGNSLSTDFIYLEFNIVKCTEACPADLEDKISRLRVEIPFVNTYFDFDDYTSPVKTYIDGRLVVDMLPGYVKRDDVFIQKNEAEIQDSYFAYQPGGSKKEFVEIHRVDSRLAVQIDDVDNTIYKLLFVKDAETKSYERQVFSLLEVTGNIGGLFEILERTGGFLVALFSGRMFLFSILTKLYHVEDPEDQPKGENNSKIKVQEDLNDGSSHVSKNSIENLIKPNEVLANKAHKAMKRRMRYHWKVSDFVYNFFSPITWLLCGCWMKKNRLNAHTRMKLYEKGEAKFLNEFDAVYYARCMRNLNTLVGSLMDDSERFMITYQKTNCISADGETESGYSDDNYDGVPKMFAKAKKRQHQVKVDDFMERYKKETWTSKDYRLLNGILSHEQLTNKQLSELQDDRDSTKLYQEYECVETENITNLSNMHPQEESKMPRATTPLQFNLNSINARSPNRFNKNSSILEDDEY
ncbi:unnamed protein product [Moneuplotes crassus]|uniref:Uncharacterized protein n=2 Tax=Euplotes crassus TaxID=5936 RepID=A0AAD2D7L7_EUPCR|nr:unnamed protein product [Moneuplotes crassus]